jgi:hypothetical protein
MIIWLLSKRGRKYVYIAMAVILLDLIVGPMLIVWELKILKDLLDSE